MWMVSLVGNWRVLNLLPSAAETTKQMERGRRSVRAVNCRPNQDTPVCMRACHFLCGWSRQKVHIAGLLSCVHTNSSSSVFKLCSHSPLMRHLSPLHCRSAGETEMLQLLAFMKESSSTTISFVPQDADLCYREEAQNCFWRSTSPIFQIQL